MSSAKNTVDDIATAYPEVSLLRELSHELSNFKSGFKGKLNHTYVLSPWASATFGFEVHEKKAYIGVPDVLFELLMNCRLFLINYLEGKPGIFIVLEMGAGKKKRPAAVRIHMRSERVKALSKFKKASLIKMKPDGTAIPGYSDEEFELDLKQVANLDWE